MVFADAAAVRSKLKAIPTVPVDGAAVPEPPPKGPGHVNVAGQDPDVADALRVLGQPGPLGWYDICKAWEIVEQAVGGSAQVKPGMGYEIGHRTASVVEEWPSTSGAPHGVHPVRVIRWFADAWSTCSVLVHGVRRHGFSTGLALRPPPRDGVRSGVMGAWWQAQTDVAESRAA